MSSKKKILKIGIIICGILLVLWSAMLGVDYWRTTYNFQKPVFAICSEGADDGGSGTYRGIGYSIEIKGNFMPEEELQGVTYAKFIIMKNEIKEAVRD